jgi:stringent starvation protein B
MNSQRPYLVRAIHEWICDNGETPMLLVDATQPGVDVPREHVSDGRIVFNVSPQATDALAMGNDAITFSARFDGRAVAVEVPVAAVLAVYSRESQHGMLFAAGEDEDGGDDDGNGDGPDGEPPKDRSHLRVIK